MKKVFFAQDIIRLDRLDVLVKRVISSSQNATSKAALPIPVYACDFRFSVHFWRVNQIKVTFSKMQHNAENACVYQDL